MEQKLIGLVPARNEANRIEFCLRALSKLTDAIIVLDDYSEDDTVQIAESLATECNVAKVIRKESWYRDEPGDRNAMLEAGRLEGGTHFVVIDADEAFTSNSLNNDWLRQRILSLRPGEQLEMCWIILWRSVNNYRFDDSVWTHNYKTPVFADDGRCSYSSDFIHTPRAPQNLRGRTYRLEGYTHGFLHFQFVNWRNLLLKQSWYRCLELIRDPDKSPSAINELYAPSKDETNLALRKSPDEWLSGYEFFDPEIFNKQDEWRVKEVLGWFEKFGREYFSELDIWDIDWDAK